MFLNFSCRHIENTSHKPVDNFLPKIPKQILPRSKKWNCKNSRKKTEFSTNDPLNLLNAALRAVVQLYNQNFDNFSLKSELKAERVPVKPLKRFLWTRRRQFWQPRGKTFDKSMKKNHKFGLSSKIEGFVKMFLSTHWMQLRQIPWTFFRENPTNRRRITEHI